MAFIGLLYCHFRTDACSSCIIPYERSYLKHHTLHDCSFLMDSYSPRMFVFHECYSLRIFIPSRMRYSLRMRFSLRMYSLTNVRPLRMLFLANVHSSECVSLAKMYLHECVFICENLPSRMRFPCENIPSRMLVFMNVIPCEWSFFSRMRFSCNNVPLRMRFYLRKCSFTNAFPLAKMFYE